MTATEMKVHIVVILLTRANVSIVNSIPLIILLCDQSSFVRVYQTIGLGFYFENPFASNGMLSWRKGYKISSGGVLKSTTF